MITLLLATGLVLRVSAAAPVEERVAHLEGLVAQTNERLDRIEARVTGLEAWRRPGS